MSADNGGPAFPLYSSLGSTHGMSLRGYFAAKAMQGLLAAGPAALVDSGKKLVPFSFEIADAMLRELAK